MDRVDTGGDVPVGLGPDRATGRPGRPTGVAPRPARTDDRRRPAPAPLGNPGPVTPCPPSAVPDAGARTGGAGLRTGAGTRPARPSWRTVRRHGPRTPAPRAAPCPAPPVGGTPPPPRRRCRPGRRPTGPAAARSAVRRTAGCRVRPWSAPSHTQSRQSIFFRSAS